MRTQPLATLKRTLKRTSIMRTQPLATLKCTRTTHVCARTLPPAPPCSCWTAPAQTAVAWAAPAAPGPPAASAPLPPLLAALWWPAPCCVRAHTCAQNTLYECSCAATHAPRGMACTPYCKLRAARACCACLLLCRVFLWGSQWAPIHLRTPCPWPTCASQGLGPRMLSAEVSPN